MEVAFAHDANKRKGLKEKSKLNEGRPGRNYTLEESKENCNCIGRKGIVKKILKKLFA